MSQKPLSPEGGSARHVGLRLPWRVYAQLEQAAGQAGCTVSEYVRRAIAAELAAAGERTREVAEAS